MSRNHARRLDAHEPQHLDPNWYTFRRFRAEVNGPSIRLRSCDHPLSYNGSTNPAHLYHLSERTA